MRTLGKAVLVVSLVAVVGGAGSAWAQYGDPLALATSGAVVPFKTTDLGVLELISPTGFNTSPPLHFVFFTEDCTRQDSVNLPMTSNDVEVLSLNALTLGKSTGGLIGIGATPDDGFTVISLREPIWARSYWFNVAQDFVRVFDPISVLYDVTLGQGTPPTGPTWNPLDSAVGFYVPWQHEAFQTTLFLICPSAAVTTLGQPFGGSDGWPPVNVASTLRGVVYDDEEVPLRDISVECTCLTELSVLDLSPVYGDLGTAPGGTYTELVSLVGDRFTGYLATLVADGVLVAEAWARLLHGDVSQVAPRDLIR